MKWTKRFLDLATLVGSWSKDNSTKVGAVIVDERNRILSVGFNGFPRGIEDIVTDRDEKLRRTVHAEENALLFANSSVEGCTIYVTHHPCARCAAKLIQVGIKKIIYLNQLSVVWGQEVYSAKIMLKEAGIVCSSASLVEVHEDSQTGLRCE